MDMGTVAALIKGLAPKASQAVIEKAVSDWLDDHPEATTTVEDGSITEAKLAADVKKAIDDTGTKITNFVTPEQFGSKGDGTYSSDEIGINAAIEYAKAHGCAVIGTGNYKTWGTISIVGENISIYLKRVNAKKPNTPAISFSGNRCNIVVDKIESASGSDGVLIYNDENNQYGCGYNKIKINTMRTGGKCINISGTSESYLTITGTVFEIEQAWSNGDHCIYVYKTWADNVFNGGSFVCSGTDKYALYISSGTWTFVNPNFENASNGIYMGGAEIELISPRFREMSDKQRDGEDGYKALKMVGYGGIIRGLKDADVYGIDVSERTFDDVPESFYSFTAGKTWRYCNSRYFGASAYQTYFNREATIIIYGNNVGIIPEDETYITVSTDTDISDLRVSPPQHFIVDDDAEITLSPSYCSIGINTFTVKQKNGAKAIVKDYLLNNVFVGTNLPDGEYKITAISESSNTGHTGYYGFYETNEWTVEKTDIEKEYRLIKQITISGNDTKIVYVNEDSDGNKFSLTDALLEFDLTAASGNGNGVIYPNTDGTTPDGSNRPGLIAQSLFQTSAVKSFAKIRVEGGRFFGESTKNMSYYYNTETFYTSSNARGKHECKSINSIQIQSMNSYFFGDGSVIKIYGK